MELTHLDETGAARMVDVGEKAVTRRTACAQSVITMKPETLRMICEDRAPKGDVFACARIAGIMAAKKTSELIPMCHPIPIESVKIDIEAVSDDLRYVQGGRPRHAHRPDAAAAQGRRQERRIQQDERISRREREI